MRNSANDWGEDAKDADTWMRPALPVEMTPVWFSVEHDKKQIDTSAKSIDAICVELLPIILNTVLSWERGRMGMPAAVWLEDSNALWVQVSWWSRDLHWGQHVRRRELSELPLITIITSTFNAGDEFSLTAASIRSQTHPRIQWIVADGGSRDGTVDLIRQNADIVDVWFSEKDEGIYDAWNKAIPHVKGQWIQFVGAGDELASPDALAKMSEHLALAHPTFDIVYGRIQLLSAGRREPLEEIGKPWSELKGKWSGRKPKLPVHPEVFHHVSIFDGDRTFDRRFRIAGDSHLLLRNVLKKDPLYVPVLVDRMPVGGVSDKISSAWNVAREIGLINRDLGIKPPLRQVLSDWAQILSKLVLQRVLPKTLLHRVADRWRVFLGKKPRFTVE